MTGFCGKLMRLMIILFCITAVYACAKKNVPAQPGFGGAAGGPGGGAYGAGGGGGGFGSDDAKWRELGINSEEERREFLSRAKDFENQDVYFDYDAYVLSPPAKKILDEKAAFLKRFPKVKVTVEGHADERGTNEYNLALGERRANSALQYLANSGIGQQNIGSVSYGEERPAVPGHDEASWAKNRRAHFVLNY